MKVETAPAATAETKASRATQLLASFRGKVRRKTKTSFSSQRDLDADVPNSPRKIEVTLSEYDAVFEEGRIGLQVFRIVFRGS
jgi:hypothetical protein